MATKAQVKAMVEALMVAAGFRPRSGTNNLDMPHLHNDALIDGLYDAVESRHYKSFYDPTTALPESPALGDTYISSATANGWTANYIYEWTGETWSETIPWEGYFVWIDDEDVFYQYDGSAWSAFTAEIGEHYHSELVAPETTEPRFYVDDEGGFVHVAPDGTKWRDVYTATTHSRFIWKDESWVDLHETLTYEP